MKKYRKSAFIILMISIAFSFSSCLVGLRHDNGRRPVYSRHHHLYEMNVYKPKHVYHRTYHTKPVKVVRKYDNDDHHNNGNNHKSNKKYKSHSKK